MSTNSFVKIEFLYSWCWLFFFINTSFPTGTCSRLDHLEKKDLRIYKILTNSEWCITLITIKSSFLRCLAMLANCVLHVLTSRRDMRVPQSTKMWRHYILEYWALFLLNRYPYFRNLIVYKQLVLSKLSPNNLNLQKGNLV